SDDGVLTKAAIKMLTVPSLKPESSLSDDKLRQTALHEVGHALGLNGHSSNPGDIMYFASVAVNSPQLSERDIKTLQLLYSMQMLPASAENKSAASP
ncbi:MAG: matrixin family metalloprotease, partial [Candidatus Obscuribacterales bacterium]|nr:matrixin family metalloprotease [Candidatus Obscuribacterales bacterium]